MNNNISQLILLFTISLLWFTSCKQVEDVSYVTVPPNIILIVSDDQGYQDLGCFGSNEIITPNLDKLASEGVKLTNFYVTWPACTPSRAGFLSGRYPQRNGIYDMIRNEAPDYGYRYRPEEYQATFERIGGMDIREKLLPELLKKAGYQSGIFGKWDLGIHQRFLPIAKGFDEFYGFTNTGIDYYTHERYGVPSMYRNNTPTEKDKGTYSTSLFQREAIRFLKEHHSKPFFLYVPFNAPHNASNLDPKIRGAAQAPSEFKNLYPHLKDDYKLLENYRYQFIDDEDSSANMLYPTRSKKRLEYLGSITAMDYAIGEILKLVEEYDMVENTIVIFFSDNGGSGSSMNTPLKGYKAWMFEGGIRVPCIIRYPKKIAAGVTNNEFLTSLEILPTLSAEAHLTLPKDIIYDGFDMMEVLAGNTKSPRNKMFWQRKNDKAARIGHWKWVESEKGNGLFNLEEDIGETTDLSEEFPEKLAEIKDQFVIWQEEMANSEPRGPFRDY